MGSSQSVLYRSHEYENQLVDSVPSKVTVDVAFQLAPNREQTGVVFVSDSGLRDASGKCNPFLMLKRAYEDRDNRTGCLLSVSLEYRKNTTGFKVDVVIDDVFSLRAGASLGSGVPHGVSQLDDGGDIHTDDTNRLEFPVSSTIPLNSEVDHDKATLYTSLVPLAQYKMWAGMDNAFKPPPLESDGDDGDSGGDAPVELFPDAHPLIRALRIHRVSMGYSASSWKQHCANDRHLHLLPSDMASTVRRHMNNTIFAKRRYTTFNSTSIALEVTDEVQRALDIKWSKRLRDGECAQPVVHVTFSLTLVTFGEGEAMMKVITTEM